MADKRLKVCVVGAGDMGVRHLKGWGKVKEAEVVALVDDAPARLQALGALLQSTTKLYADYRQAIDEARPDVVSVCVPTAYHAQVSLYAIERGAHVMCEKPIALTLEEADMMMAAAQEKGVLLTVGFMLRYSPAVLKLKDWIINGTIGRPLMIVSENFMEVRPKVLMHAKKVNGGPLMDYWCHHFDLWSYLFDSKPVSVSGYGTIFAQGKPEVALIPELAVDTAAISIKYQSGDVAQLSTSWGLPKMFANHHISSDKIFGPKGIIVGDIRKQMTLMNEAGNEEEVKNSGVDWWQTQISAFAHTIQEGGKPLVRAQNGREALKLSLAALQAIESGLTVML